MLLMSFGESTFINSRNLCSILGKRLLFREPVVFANKIAPAKVLNDPLFESFKVFISNNFTIVGIYYL